MTHNDEIAFLFVFNAIFWFFFFFLVTFKNPGGLSEIQAQWKFCCRKTVTRALMMIGALLYCVVHGDENENHCKTNFYSFAQNLRGPMRSTAIHFVCYSICVLRMTTLFFHSIRKLRYLQKNSTFDILLS